MPVRPTPALADRFLTLRIVIYIHSVEQNIAYPLLPLRSEEKRNNFGGQTGDTLVYPQRETSSIDRLEIALTNPEGGWWQLHATRAEGPCLLICLAPPLDKVHQRPTRYHRLTLFDPPPPRSYAREHVHCYIGYARVSIGAGVTEYWHLGFVSAIFGGARAFILRTFCSIPRTWNSEHRNMETFHARDRNK